MHTTKKVKILLIEEDENEYALLKELLSESLLAEYNIDRVASFDDGLRAVCQPQHDAVLVDNKIGEHTGLDFLAEASRKGCDPPMILLRKSNGGVDLLAAAAGAAESLVKGEISSEILYRSIRFAIERRAMTGGIKTDAPPGAYSDTSFALKAMRSLLEEEVRRREQADLALKQSEEKYRTLLENSPDIIYTVSIDGKILSVNPSFEQITGYSAEESIGKEYFFLMHPDDIPLLRARREKLLRGEKLQPAEARVRTKTGETKVLEFNSALLSEGDRMIGIIGTARDVTSRKKAEERVIAQNDFLNTVLESLAHPFYVLDTRDYNIVMANAAASPEKIPPNTKCYALFHKSDAPCGGSEHFCPLEEVKRTKKPLITEHIHYDHDGTPRYVEIHSHPILGADGEVSNIIEYILDITDRKKMEDDLRRVRDELEDRVRLRTAELATINAALRSEIRERKRAEEALRLDEIRLEALLEFSQMSWSSEEEVADYVLEQQVKLTDSTLGLIGFLDDEERLLDLHTWTTEYIPECGLPESPVRYEIAYSGLWADAVRLRRPVLINNPELLETTRASLPCGNIPLQRLLSIPVFDGDGIVAIAIVANKKKDYDQSDVRQLTLLMDGMWKLMVRGRSAKALREAESLAGIGRALSSVAHDLKTPLVAIGGFTRMVQRHIPRDCDDWEKMEIVLRETKRLENMVGSMLDFSKPLELDQAPEDIYRLVSEVLEIARPIADKKGVLLVAEPCRNPPDPVMMDGGRLKQAILNLLTNAIDATPAGRSVRLNCARKGSKLTIEVTDCGCGIPVEHRKEIFIPFFTTKKEGTGLGLPIVKKIAEAHKGGVEILDNPDEGLTFRLTLPVR